MLLVYVLTVFSAAVIFTTGNAWLNYSDMMRRGGVFGDVSDWRFRKCVAFFMVHRQRGYDKHVFLAERVVDGKRRLDMGFKPIRCEFAAPSKTRDVEYAMPFITIAAGVALFLVVTGWGVQIQPLPVN